ncbi:DsrE family protein [Desulfobulbus alkaliphilus]|uniref:DsrE family protein n=1 Tax=Desulfobulbus alkaliphilus TaxID=869814 RepID=UPI0019632796|nr:DsrE family protein [Desulfobulbus alkaliphilus]MBM9537105.1 DsrE family protein [Desulfobulbus alkaliphilus]
MKKLMIFIAAMALFAAGGNPAAAAGHGGEAVQEKKLFVTLVDVDSQARGMTLVLANQAAAQGAEVRVLLCGDGAQLALREYNPPKLRPRDVTPKQLLENLMQNGAIVEVCAIFLPNTGYSAEDLTDGIGVANPAEVAEYMMQPNVKLFTR